MADARRLDADESRTDARHQTGALDLSRRLPALIVAAKEVATTVMYGVHGRRRAGVGETFWQFRPFVWGEATTRIDWRRSARDDRVYVREREWEAAHTMWLWIDRSPSMAYVSSLAMQPKVDRAITLGLATADLLVRGGERVGLIGETRALATRGIIERFSEAMIQAERRGEPARELPPPDPLSTRAQAILIGDFLSAPDEIARTIHAMASRGAMGHVIMIADPVEETFPFAGHMEFVDVDSAARLRVGEARTFKADYIARLAAHRDALRETCRSRGWSFMIHRTDRPASGALLDLRARTEGVRVAAGQEAG